MSPSQSPSHADDTTQNRLIEGMRIQKELGPKILLIMKRAVRSNKSLKTSGVGTETKPTKTLCAAPIPISGEYGIAIGLCDKDLKTTSISDVIGDPIVSVIINGFEKTIFVSGLGWKQNKFDLSQFKSVCKRLSSFLRQYSYDEHEKLKALQN